MLGAGWPYIHRLAGCGSGPGHVAFQRTVKCGNLALCHSVHFPGI